MLLATYDPQGAQHVQSKEILNHISASCRTQNISDEQFLVHWSRHLLANIPQFTGCELLIETSAVTYNPHFPHFASLTLRMNILEQSQNGPKYQPYWS
jgi:hypothetical protein